MLKFRLSMSNYPALRSFTDNFAYLVLFLIYDLETTGVSHISYGRRLHVCCFVLLAVISAE